MGKKDPHVDAYISKSADFARPILTHIRSLVHAGCPVVEETMKWGFPHFMHKGILCSMASFKEHCAFGFWKGKLVFGKEDVASDEAMGHFGRIASIGDLPGDKVILGYIRTAARLNDEGVSSPTRVWTKKTKPLDIPPYLKAALAKSKRARATFKGFNYSNKKEYVEWIAEAKTDETRQKRLQTAIDWMAEGKVRNWKYIKK